MNNLLDNLGDYNKVRIDLQKAGGNMEKLYKEVGDTAIAKAAPILLVTGAGIAACCFGLAYFGKKGIESLKNRRDKIKNEASLKGKFFKATEVIVEENTEKTNANLTEEQ